MRPVGPATACPWPRSEVGTRRSLAPGLVLEEGTFRGAPYHLLEVDRSQGREIRPVFTPAPWGRRVSRIHSDAGALATVNGTFFGYLSDGRPLVYGEVKNDTVALRPTMVKKRSYLGVTADGALVMGDTERSGTRWSIPPARWNQLRHVLGGGGRLVKEGRPASVGAGENDQGFQDDVLARRNRTAVGFAGEKVWLVCSDVPGWTPEVTAEFMVARGAREAMFLDGGGSTTMVADGRVQNRLSAGAERPMPTALAIL